MRRQILAMGGGGFSMEPDNPLLDAYACALTGKSAPRVCFVGTAGFDSPYYAERFHAAWKRFTPHTSTLNLVSGGGGDPREVLLAQDLIYVGGGNTVNLMKVWQAAGVDAVMREGYERGIVLAGISAGSICWFEQALTDSLTPDLTPMSCLGILKGSNCVHYDGEPNRRPRFHQEVSAGRMLPGIACDDGVAAHFVDDALAAVVSSRPAARAYRVGREGGKAVESEILPRYLGGAFTDGPAVTVLRRACLADVPGIVAAYQASVRAITAKDYSVEQVSAWTARIAAAQTAADLAYQIAHEAVWVAEVGGNIEGFAHFRTPADIHPAAYVHALYLTPTAAGRGLGRRLMALLEEHAVALGFTRLGLHSSRTARGFYEALGYAAAGNELLHYVQDVGLPCQPMAKDLPRAPG